MKARTKRAFYWLDVKLSRLLHFPKPIDWDAFDKQLKEAIEEDKRRTIAMIEDAKQVGRREVVEWVEEHTTVDTWTGWYEQKEWWGIDENRTAEAGD